jgi:phosphoglycolate phosphatase
VLLVFDLDGTLIDSSQDLADAVNAALQRVAPGTTTIPVPVVTGFIGDGARVLVSRALRHAGLALEPEQMLPAFMDCYATRLLQTTRLYDGIAGALPRLAPATLAVLTNKPGAFSRTILDGLGVARHFSRVWGPEDASARKPDPAGLLRLVDELGAQARSTWMIGDSSIDVETARAAGIRCAGVLWGLDPARLRASAPDRLLQRPGELEALLAA